VFIWLAQNLVLLASSLWRLDMYVSCYSLTLLRLAAGIWMGLVGGGLALIAWRLWRQRSNAWLLDANALLLVVVLAIVAWCDCRGSVAWYNAHHCKQIDGNGAPLDLDYLMELGLASRPALVWLSEQPVDQLLKDRAGELARRHRDSQEARRSDWRWWTIRREGWSQATTGR
jgi:hypothetical protein